MSKFSSYKEHQLIMENWRRFLAEEQPDPHSALEELRKQVPGLVVTEDPNGNQVISPTPDQSSAVLTAIHNLGGAEKIGLSVQKNADGTITVFPTKSAEVDEGLMDKVKGFFGKKGAQPKPIFGKKGIKHLKNGTFVDDYTEEDDDKAETAAIAATQALWDKDNGESYRSWAAEQLATRYASELAKIDYKPSISLRSDFGQTDSEIVSKLDAIWSKGAKGKKAAVRDYKQGMRDQDRAEREEREDRSRDRERERRGRSLSPEEKKRAAQERDAKFKSKQYNKDQERRGYKDKRVGNVGSASSGFAGRSGMRRKE